MKVSTLITLQSLHSSKGRIVQGSQVALAASTYISDLNKLERQIGLAFTRYLSDHLFWRDIFLLQTLTMISKMVWNRVKTILFRMRVSVRIFQGCPLQSQCAMCSTLEASSILTEF